MTKTPYAEFGKKLKNIREKAQESIAELSGAVEFDTKALIGIEQGVIQPPEDLLILMIGHFDLSESEAVKLWKLAGYNQGLSLSNPIINDKNMVKMAIVSPADIKIMYTDMVHVSANRYGVVVNFLQGLGVNQPIAVSRIGMSHEHAKSLIKVLQQTVKLTKTQPNQDKKPSK